MNGSLADRMKPRTKHAVRELVEQAGIDVADWAVDRNGRVLENPNENVYKSFKWSFGGSGQPIALCIRKRSKKNSMHLGAGQLRQV